MHFTYNQGPYLNSDCLRDIVVDQDGVVDAFNGTFSPILTRFSADTDQFTYRGLLPDWGILAGPEFGKITAIKNFVFVTDTHHDFYPNGTGVIRYDTATGSSIRFVVGYDALDASVGHNGKLYVLVPGPPFHVRVYDPETLTFERDVTLPDGVFPLALAIDQAGRLFGADSDGVLYRLNSDGQIELQQHTGLTGLYDIAVNSSGRIIIGQSDGHVVVTDSSFGSYTSFSVENDPNASFWALFVSFAEPIGGGKSLPKPPPTPTPSPTPTITPPIGPPGELPQINVLAVPSSVFEGQTAQFIFSTSLINPSGPTVINYSITGKAIQGLDYVLDGTPGQVIIPPGGTTAVINFHTLPDAVKERSEKVTLTVLKSSSYTLPRSKKIQKATITIVNQGGSR